MRDLLDAPLDQIDCDRLRAVLAAAGDEDDRWEAKGGTLRAEHVFRAVAGLANRDGGLLAVGATRSATGGWQLPGCTMPGEPGQWLARVVRDNLHPAPPIDVRTWEVAPGLHAALVRVQRHPTHLAVTHDGRVLRREHGSTEPIADGAELTRLVRARSGAGPAAPLDPDGDPDELGDAALDAIQAGQEARLRSFVAGLQARLPRAAEFAPAPVLDQEADRLSAVTAALAQAVPDSPVTAFAVAGHHRVFDATAIRPLPGGRPDLDLQRVVLRHARALGGALVRLELWALVRALADHDAPDPAIYAGLDDLRRCPAGTSARPPAQRRDTTSPRARRRQHPPSASARCAPTAPTSTRSSTPSWYSTCSPTSSSSIDRNGPGVRPRSRPTSPSSDSSRTAPTSRGSSARTTCARPCCPAA